MAKRTHLFVRKTDSFFSPEAPNGTDESYNDGIHDALTALRGLSPEGM